MLAAWGGPFQLPRVEGERRSQLSKVGVFYPPASLLSGWWVGFEKREGVELEVEEDSETGECGRVWGQGELELPGSSLWSGQEYSVLYTPMIRA